MSYYLFDPSKLTIRPKFWIAKPNKNIITRIKELDDTASLKVELGTYFELSGEIPFQLTRHIKKVVNSEVKYVKNTTENPHAKYIKNKYLIKMEFMNNVEWFVIENVNKNGNTDGDKISFTAYSTVYNLRGKKLYNDSFEGVTPEVALNDLLKNTTWGVGKISYQIKGKIRTFDELSSDTNILEAIFSMAESYGGIVTFDTEKNLVNLLHKDDLAVVSGLMLNDKNYIESFSKDSDSNEIVTRLYAHGSEDLTFNSVSPTGKSYIEKFDWYMYPFKRDVNKNVISHSDYMTDALCNAILDQQEAIINMEIGAKNRMELMSKLEDELDTLQNTEEDIQLTYDTVQGILDVMRANQEYWYCSFDSSTKNYSFNFRKGYYYVQARAKNGYSSASLSFNGTVRNLTNTWSTFKYDMNSLDPLGDGQLVNVVSLTNDCEFMTVRVPIEEYNDYTDQQVLDKYNIMYWDDKLQTAKNNVTNKENEIQANIDALNALYESVGDDNFFTLELLREKAEFTYEYHWTEESHTDPQEMYDDAVGKLNDLHKPTLNIDTDIYNFLASLDDKRNWNKLILGSKVRVKHSRLNEYNEVILMSIDYDFNSDSIKLNLSDVKDLNADEFAKAVMQGANASHQLTLNKYLYDEAVAQSRTFEEILNSAMDATKRRILAGVHESVIIDNRGIKIITPDYPNEMLIATAGVLGLSKDGGQTFPTAISPDGIHGDKIIGKIFIGQKLLIRDDDGTMILNGSLQTIKDRNGKIQVLLGEYESNKFGLKIPDGAVEIYTDEEPNRGVVLDGQGIRGYNGSGMNTFDLDTDGFLKLYGGEIDIRTSFGANQGVILDGYGLHGFNIDRDKTFDLNTEGFLKLYGGYIDIRTSFGANQGIVFDGDGFRAYNSDNELTVNIESDTGNVTIKGDLTGSNGLFNGTIRSSSHDTDGNETSYTLIDGGTFESHGVYFKNWGDTVQDEENEMFIRIEDGVLRFRNETKDWSLYMSDYGISTYKNGTASLASGTLMFRDVTYHNPDNPTEGEKGITLHSTAGIVALASEKSAIYINPMKTSREGNNLFKFYVKSGDTSSDTDGVLMYGSHIDSTPFASGIRFSKASSDPTVWITDNTGGKKTGNLVAKKIYGEQVELNNITSTDGSPLRLSVDANNYIEISSSGIKFVGKRLDFN